MESQLSVSTPDKLFFDDDVVDKPPTKPEMTIFPPMYPVGTDINYMYCQLYNTYYHTFQLMNYYKHQMEDYQDELKLSNSIVDFLVKNNNKKHTIKKNNK